MYKTAGFPENAITETEEKTEEFKWRSEKDLRGTFLNMRAGI